MSSEAVCTIAWRGLNKAAMAFPDTADCDVGNGWRCDTTTWPLAGTGPGTGTGRWLVSPTLDISAAQPVCTAAADEPCDPSRRASRDDMAAAGVEGEVDGQNGCCCCSCCSSCRRRPLALQWLFRWCTTTGDGCGVRVCVRVCVRALLCCSMRPDHRQRRPSSRD
ncbi:hypothetical protein BC831DRAFT_477289, partial [Entophlyctis helioformis]